MNDSKAAAVRRREPAQGLRSLVSLYMLKRCGAVLLVLAAIFAVAGAGVAVLEQQLSRELLAHERQRVMQWLDDALEAGGTPLRLFVESYARRTSFTRPDRESTGASPEVTLASGMRTHNLAAAWVVEADGRVRLAAGAGEKELLAPISGALLAEQRNRTVRYYLRSGEALFEVRGSRLSGSQQPADRRGWLFGAVRMDRDGVLGPLARMGEEVAILAPREAAVLRGMEPGTFRIERELKDLAGTTVGVLRLERRPLAAEANAKSFRTGLTVMAAFGALSIAVLGAGLAYWLIAPARKINLALLRHDAAAIRPLIDAGGEIGRLAQAATGAIERQVRLEQSLAERERLARELHDGVVESLRTAGLGVVSAQQLAAARPEEARRVLGEVQSNLDEAIGQLRGVIAGLGPEELQQRSFAEAVEAVAMSLQSVRAVRLAFEIDEAVAGRLSVPERMHLLQVVRAATSHAVRQGRAEAVTIALRAEPGGAVLEIVDDGTTLDGFGEADPSQRLARLNAEAREIGGIVTLKPHAEAGTVLRLILPRRG